MRRIILYFALTCLSASTLAAQPGPSRGSEFEYPDAHDPVAAFCDGRYYVFTTGMGIMSSADMKTWRFEGRVLESIPQWAADKGFRGMPWAPDVQFINGQYYVYYSYSKFGKCLWTGTSRSLPDRSKRLSLPGRFFRPVSD